MSSAQPLTFAEGQIVAARFRIVRFIAAGGMGELYEAEDSELHEHVALKTIRPEIAQDANAIARFKREAFLARQVTHPNICRIFDLFRHQPSGPGPAITFVTMELLAGETLADRLRRGRLTVDEALPLVAQMAAALDAAHQVGVVHRDFKSNNVMLVPQPDGTPRIVVTDFGLAVRPEDIASGDHARPTMSGQILGTPDYMAPEQVEGGELTPATDVYALGLVMYEMVTGKRPFAAATPLAAAVRRLSEPPRPPGDLVPDLDHTWESAILRCLERRPGDRFARAGDVVKELDTPSRSRFLTPDRVRVAMGVALLAVVAAVGTFLWRTPQGIAGRAGAAGCGSARAGPSIGRRARVQEPVRPAGRGLALDRVLRDVDDRARRGRAAADDPWRERGADEDGSGAGRRRCLRVRHAGAHPRQPWHGPGRVRLVRHGRRARQGDHSSRRPPAGLAGRPDPRARQRDQSRDGRPAAGLSNRRAPARTARPRCLASGGGCRGPGLAACHRRRGTLLCGGARAPPKLRRPRCARSAGARGCRRWTIPARAFGAGADLGDAWATTIARGPRRAAPSSCLPVCRGRNACP